MGRRLMLDCQTCEFLPWDASKQCFFHGVCSVLVHALPRRLGRFHPHRAKLDFNRLRAHCLWLTSPRFQGVLAKSLWFWKIESLGCALIIPWLGRTNHFLEAFFDFTSIRDKSENYQLQLGSNVGLARQQCLQLSSRLLHNECLESSCTGPKWMTDSLPAEPLICERFPLPVAGVCWWWAANRKSVLAKLCEGEPVELVESLW